MKKNKFLIIFCFLVLIDLFCFLFEPKLTYFTKPLIIGGLLAHYIVEVPSQNRHYILALIFEMLAQVFLAFSKNDTSYFLSKIASVLVFVFLIFVYRKAVDYPADSKMKWLTFVLIIGLILNVLYYKIQLYENIFLIDYLLLTLVYCLVLLGINLKSYGKILALLLGPILLGISKIFAVYSSNPIDLIPILFSFALGHYLMNFGLVESFKKAKQ